MKVDNNYDKKVGIYCILNTVNNKKYVGSSKTIKSRLYQHKYHLRKNIHKNPYLQNSWNKHGENNFQCFVLEFCKIEQLNEREEYYIKLFGDYNCAKFDDGRLEYSKETKEKMSKSRLKGFKEGSIKPYQDKAIEQFDLQGNFIKEFKNIDEAVKEVGMYRSTMTRHLNGKLKIAKGYQWRIKGDNKEIKPYKKTKDNSYLNKALEVKDLETGEILNFNSISECADYFKVTPAVIDFTINRSKNKIYKYRYKIGLVKPSELLES